MFFKNVFDENIKTFFVNKKHISTNVLFKKRIHKHIKFAKKNEIFDTFANVSKNHVIKIVIEIDENENEIFELIWNLNKIK